MAGAAINGLCLDIIMRAFEGVIAQVVAFPADLIDRFIQQGTARRHMAAVAT